MRQDLSVRGLVQGVGFRPWVWRLATGLGLSGWVRNTGGGVQIALSGPADLVTQFREALWQAPSPARVEGVDAIHDLDGPALSPHGFEIVESVAGSVSTSTGADLGVCQLCLNELLDPKNRRWGHPFIHCPQCGPRYTAVHRLPFDRPHTSLAPFALCKACEQEVSDPSDRRFHDQTNACNACGPRLSFVMPDGSSKPGDPIDLALEFIQAGRIVAIKGVGGFHLCCDAQNAQAVQTLRQRKGRPSQALAVMAADVASLSAWVDMSEHEARWLERAERPIVLLRQSGKALSHLQGLAPGLAWLGAMLPYTALHHLIFQRHPGGLWVMTSANASGEPLAVDNHEALQRLSHVADAFLMHDRDIMARNDDSVLRVRPDGSACFLRRGRGFAPSPHRWPKGAASTQDNRQAPHILALGGDLKSTLTFCRAALHSDGDHEGRVQVSVSPHIGNLDQALTRVAFKALTHSWPELLSASPQVIACDLHPDYFSSRTAAALAAELGCTLLPVQHHHAHIAAVLAEHADSPQSLGPVIGLALDGHGMGSDGQAWGAELLKVERDQCERLGHLRRMSLPGSERAAREPWRMAASVLHALGMGEQIMNRFGHEAGVHIVKSLLDNGAPTSSSMGRLFDAAAALLGVLSMSQHEADAAMRLESLALSAWPAETLPQGCLVVESAKGLSQLDWGPLMRWLAQQDTEHSASQAHAAAVFHATLAWGLAQWAQQASQAQHIHTIVLSGGCMANALLDEALTHHLSAMGLTVWRASQYPCGDGGLSLGQAWIAHHRVQHPTCSN